MDLLTYRDELIDEISGGRGRRDHFNSLTSTLYMAYASVSGPGERRPIDDSMVKCNGQARPERSKRVVVVWTRSEKSTRL